MNETNEREEAAPVGVLPHEAVVIPQYSKGTEGVVLMDGQPLSPDDLVKLLNINERLLAERQRVVDAIPECPVHGSNCVPHALEWIRARA